MIAHLRIPDFPAKVFQIVNGLRGDPVVVQDESRVVSVSPEARELGLEAGKLVETVDIPDEVNICRFELQKFADENQRFRELVQDLSPLVENLELGEIFVEVEAAEKAEDWFESQQNFEYPLCGCAAETGWLARIISARQGSAEFERVEPDQYEEAIQSVQRDEMWGLGKQFMETLRKNGLKQMGELYYLKETERRKLFGKQSRILHILFDHKDPRPLSVFSRPRSLSQEISLEPEIGNEKEKICKELGSVLKRIQKRLRDTVSLAYRLRVRLQFEREGNLMRSHIFSSPTGDRELFEFALRKMTADVALTKPVRTAAVEADVIVADMENYHQKTQEVPADFEILES